MNFALSEFINSDSAKALGIDNMPKAVSVFDNLLLLIVNVLQPLRDAYGKPLYVNSGFRCERLNKAVGGAANSQHLYGQAADITTGTKAGNKALLQLAQRLNLPFDQMINEKPDASGNPSWVHLSYRKNPRRQVIIVK